jgi:hypothetical protein
MKVIKKPKHVNLYEVYNFSLRCFFFHVNQLN